MDYLIIIFSNILIIAIGIISIRVFNNYRQDRELTTLVFLTFIIILNIMIVIYSIRGYIDKQSLLGYYIAYFAYVSSLVFISICNVLLVYYFHLLNGFYKELSYFYIFISGMLAIIFLQEDWQVIWIDGIGYTNPLSDQFLIIFNLHVFLLLLFTLFTVEGKKKTYFAEIEVFKEDINQKQYIEQIRQKYKMLNIILSGYIIGIILGMISLFPGIYYMDYIALLFMFVPQTYCIIKDKDIFKLTKTNIKAVYIMVQSGVTLVDWIPKNSVHTSRSLVSGLNTAMKAFSKELFDIDCSIQKLNIENFLLISLDREIKNKFGKIIVGILVVVEKTSPALEYLTKKTISEFVKIYNDENFDGIVDVSRFKDFKNLINKKFSLFI